MKIIQVFFVSCLMLCYANAFAEYRQKDYSYSDSFLNRAENNDDRTVSTSPKDGWGDFTLIDNKKSSRKPFWMDILLWVPNRVLDFVDIFRVDVGVGPAVGGVVRLTEYGSFGARIIAPASVRFGLFGRQSPLVIENSSEFGIGPAFVSSKKRNTCKGEIGLGLDLLIFGANAGICIDELADFVAGIFFFDIMNDDEK